MAHRNTTSIRAPRTTRSTPDPTAISVAFIRGPEATRAKESVIFLAMAYWLENRDTGSDDLNRACEALHKASNRAIKKAEYRTKSS